MTAPPVQGPVLEVDVGGQEPARPLQVPTTTASRLLAQGRWIVYGWSFRETTGAAAAIWELYDGYDDTGELVASTGLAQATSDSQALMDVGVLMERGVYLNVVSGSITGSVWARRVRWQ